ncbi:hypothetical protein UFOVP450_16 [uncultured Caudovirales phage]|uniref:AAA domain containing protein n=1 Tax=uncultured Caudovirales phage TaxID=2100421 RepID=A0A6J5MBY1_9CAUD|nr:hypothetical protein UFOVP450_16 [uncultured Caudovirales phage]
MKLTLLFGRICSGKSSLYKDSYRIVASNLVRGIVNSASREDLQNTMHLDDTIAEAIIMSIDYVIDENPHVVVDGIRQASIVEKVLQHYPNAELVWLEVPVEERKRRYEARKDAKDVEAFEIADNKPIELECQNIFSIFKEQLRIINN